jgi:hypothetical protein
MNLIVADVAEGYQILNRISATIYMLVHVMQL